MVKTLVGTGEGEPEDNRTPQEKYDDHLAAERKHNAVEGRRAQEYMAGVMSRLHSPVAPPELIPEDEPAAKDVSDEE